MGLNEGTRGTTPPRQAIEGLHKLTSQLNDGISLLVLVMRAPRITVLTQQNYIMFRDIICKKEVPIVIVITGLEYEESMDGWWETNHEAFDKYGMHFGGHACITATRGSREVRFEDEYEASKKKVQELIDRSLSSKMRPWVPPQKTWLADTVMASKYLLSRATGHSALAIDPELNAALASYGEVVGQDVLKDGGKAREVESTPNILFVGEGCAAPNSITIMLDDDACPTNGLTPRRKTIKGSVFNVYESTGFPVPDGVRPAKVVDDLYFHARDGINLLVLVGQASDKAAAIGWNYRILSHLFSRHVPIAILITGVDSGKGKEWWESNKIVFDNNAVPINGHACISVTTGWEGSTSSCSGESKNEVESLICEVHSKTLRRNEHSPGAISMIRSRLPAWTPQVLSPGLKKALELCDAASEKDSAVIANKIEWRHYRKQTWDSVFAIYRRLRLDGNWVV